MLPQNYLTFEYSHFKDYVCVIQPPAGCLQAPMTTFERLVPNKLTHHMYLSVLCNFQLSFPKYDLIDPDTKGLQFFRWHFKTIFLHDNCCILIASTHTLPTPSTSPPPPPPPTPPPPPNGLGNVFISVDHLVSLSTTLWMKTWMKIFWICWAWYIGQSVKCWSDTLSPWMQIFYHFIKEIRVY